MFDHDDAEDLAWLYMYSDGDCGLKSRLGGQIQALEAAQLAPGCPTKSEVWQRKPKKNYNASDPIEDRLIDAATRARAIMHRVGQLSHRTQYVLELQYGEVTSWNGCSLGLLTATKAATESYARAVERGTWKGQDMSTKTAREWVLELFKLMNKHEAIKAWVDKIVTEATNDLEGAQVAYDRTTEKS